MVVHSFLSHKALDRIAFELPYSGFDHVDTRHTSKSIVREYQGKLGGNATVRISKAVMEITRVDIVYPSGDIESFTNEFFSKACRMASRLARTESRRLGR